jgi:hypothetical protein
MEQPSSPHEQSPFSHELNASPNIDSKTAKFQELQSRPDLVVKELNLPMFKDMLGDPMLGETPVAYLQRHAARGQALQREFSAHTGIKTPESQLLVGKNQEGETSLYRVSQQVLGEDLSDAITHGTVSDNELEKFVGSIYDYYDQKAATGEDFVSEVAQVDQYRFGRLPGEAADSIHLADTDPYYLPGSTPDLHPEDIIAEIPDLIDHISQLRGRPVAQDLRERILDEHPPDYELAA